MTLQFGLLAEYATVGSGNRLIIVHTFDKLLPTPDKIGQPIGFGVIVMRVQGSLTDAGAHHMSIILADEDENPMGVELAGDGFELGVTGPGLPLASQLILPLAPILMPVVGEYKFVVRVGDEPEGYLIGDG